MTHRSIHVARLALIASALIVASTQETRAESACKGLDQANCAAKTECGWTNGYTRKDGIQVTGHCRTSAKKKESATASPSKPMAPVASGAAAAAMTTTPATPSSPLMPPTAAGAASGMPPAAPAQPKQTP